MGANTQGLPGYYIWEIPGHPVAVHLHLEVVDHLLAEVMRGFGSVPKRGAEIGGVLIGTIEPGDPAIVRVEDFERVECEYKRGPSYLLTDEDLAAFGEACNRWERNGSRPAYSVGFFRSHTREGFALAPEDVDLLNRYFPSPLNIALLVKPYGTKASVAGFFFRENGVFQESTLLEFPFQRHDLIGEELPPRRPIMERRPRSVDLHAMLPTGLTEEQDFVAEPMAPAGPAPTPFKTLLLRTWVLVTLSIIILLFGLLLGFWTAFTIGPKFSASNAQELSLGLALSRNEDNLSISWDRQSPAIRAAQHGILEIEDGNYIKSVDLDASQLQSGNVTYRTSSNSVRFRLLVYHKTRLTVTETIEWKQ